MLKYFDKKNSEYTLSGEHPKAHRWNKRFANRLLPLYFRATAKRETNRLTGDDLREPRVIVSLTSFPPRIATLWIVIETLLRQSFKTDRIILWLSEEEFPAGIEDLPKKLVALRKRGLEIEFRPGNLRSHKKYYYAMTEYPDDIVITVDDDVFYGTDTLKALWDMHLKFPDAICAGYAFPPTYIDGKLAPYVDWNSPTAAFKPDTRYFPLGICGVLYPPKSLALSTFDVGGIEAAALSADDLWLKAGSVILKTPVVSASPRFTHPLNVKIRENRELWSENKGGGNDKALSHIRQYYIEKMGVDPFDENSY